MTSERTGDPVDPDMNAAHGGTDDPRGQPEAADSTADSCIGCGLCGRHLIAIKNRRPVSPRPQGETQR